MDTKKNNNIEQDFAKKLKDAFETLPILKEKAEKHEEMIAEILQILQNLEKNLI